MKVWFIDHAQVIWIDGKIDAFRIKIYWSSLGYVDRSSLIIYAPFHQNYGTIEIQFTIFPIDTVSQLYFFVNNYCDVFNGFFAIFLMSIEKKLEKLNYSTRGWVYW